MTEEQANELFQMVHDMRTWCENSGTCPPIFVNDEGRDMYVAWCEKRGGPPVGPLNHAESVVWRPRSVLR